MRDRGCVTGAHGMGQLHVICGVSATLFKDNIDLIVNILCHRVIYASERVLILSSEQKRECNVIIEYCFLVFLTN